MHKYATSKHQFLAIFLLDTQCGDVCTIKLRKKHLPCTWKLDSRKIIWVLLLSFVVVDGERGRRAVGMRIRGYAGGMMIIVIINVWLTWSGLDDIWI